MKGLAPGAILLLASCAGEPPPHQRALWTAETGLVFCYATLADPGCARAPVAGADQRLIAAAPRLTFVPHKAAPRRPGDQIDERR